MKLRGCSRLKDALAFQYADADYCDKSDNAYNDERINVFQRNFGEVLIEILKGVQLAAVGTVRFLFSPFRGSLRGLVFDFICHSGLLLGQVLAQVKGNGDDDDKALCNVGVSGVDAEELQANL